MEKGEWKMMPDTTSLAGWRCPKCLTFVPYGQYHGCGGESPSTTYVINDNRLLVEKLDEIIKLLKENRK
jgi:hypothetical protein